LHTSSASSSCAGTPAARGRKGNTANDSLKAVRAAERDLAAQAEAAYRTMVAAWQPSGGSTTSDPQVL
jgi:hypothetical protein